MAQKKSKKKSKSTKKKTPTVTKPDVTTGNTPDSDQAQNNASIGVNGAEVPRESNAPSVDGIKKKIEEVADTELTKGFKFLLIAKTTDEILNAANMLTVMYENIRASGSYELLNCFFSSFMTRLDCLLKLSFTEDNLIPAFKGIASFALRKQEAGDEEIMNRLIEKLEYVCQCMQLNKRINGVALAGRLISASRLKGGKNMNLPFEKRHGMSQKQLRSLYNLLLDRRTDEPEVRHVVLLGLQAIQNDPIPNSIPEMRSKTPKDHFTLSLSDADSNVRMTAIKFGTFDGVKDYEKLMFIAMSDEAEQVRFTSLVRLGLVSPRMLSFEKRLPFLYYTLLDSHPIVSDAAREYVIDKWIDHYQETYAKLMNLSSTSNDKGELSENEAISYTNDNECDHVAPAIALMIFPFELEKGYHTWSMTNVVTMTIIDRARRLNHPPDDPLSDFIRVLILNRHSKDFMPFLHRSNFDKILDFSCRKSNADSFKRISHLIVKFPENAPFEDCFRLRVVYIWLAFMHFVKQNSVDESDQQRGFYELAPDLSTACFVVNRLLDVWSKTTILENSERGKETHAATLYHLLAGLTLLDRDKMGMVVWHDLLIRILSNEWNLKFVINQAVSDLTNHYGPEELYKVLVSTTSDKLKKLSDEKETKPCESSHMISMELNVETYEISLIHAYLLSAEVDSINEDLDKRCMDAFHKTYNPEITELVLESLAMCKVIDKTNMLELLRTLMATVLKFDENLNVLEAIYELCRKCGYVEINNIAKQAADLNTVMYGSEPVEGIMDLLCEIVVQEERHGVKIILNTVTAMANLLLATDIVDTMYEVSKRAYVSLLIRSIYSDPSTYDGPLDDEDIYEKTKHMFEIDAVLTNFLATFAAKSKKNQVFIKDCFKLFYTFKMPIDVPISPMLVEYRHSSDIAHQFAKLTSNSVLHDNQMSFVHLDFLREATDWILDENESADVRYFASIVVPLLEIVGSEKNMLKEIRRKLEKGCLLDDNIVVTGGLKNMIRRIDKAIVIIDGIDELSRVTSEGDEEISDEKLSTVSTPTKHMNKKEKQDADTAQNEKMPPKVEILENLCKNSFSERLKQSTQTARQLFC